MIDKCQQVFELAQENIKIVYLRRCILTQKLTINLFEF
ncbi:hypothetical protein M595_1139 [Lyngbya aestuarii BL J]|uniref:Uncharacterized protein n=1 Tax=Lyngbya aestuarii BL J TaxID=1348334 RepID=U7QLR1_9CYAN|nr:hypothetical protein M595_1139 [Lyngbya aestuarii BL J]